MAYSDNFPSQRPSFMFDASNGGRIPPNMTYTRASTANVFDGAKHLSSENLLKYSTGFDSGTWTGSGLSDRDPAQTDPSGATNGVTLVEDSSNAYHRVYQGISVASASPIAFTIFAKRNSGSRYLMLTLSNGVNNSQVAVFDLAGGAPTTGAGTGSTYTSVTATQTASGNGYYKCVLKATGGLVSAHVSLVDSGTPAPDLYGLKLYTGDGSSSIDVAFASLSTTGATDYNATTTQIHREYASSLVSKANNAARFEVGTDGQSVAKGILIEGQTTNLVTYGIDFASWSKLRSTVQANAAIGPDGTLSADALIEDTTSTASHFISSNTITPAASTAYTYSVYLKAAGRSNAMLYTDIGNVNVNTFFNLTNGTVTSTQGSVTSACSSVGNGWFRCSMTFTTTNTASANVRIYTVDSSGSYSYTGNGYSGLLCYGAQVEQNSFPSSLVVTNSSTATRAADSLSVATADIGYTGGPMTLVTDTSVSDPTSTEFRAAAYVYVDNYNSAGIWATSSDSRIARVETGGVGGNVGTNSGVNGIAALSIDTNDIATCLNGGTVATDTSHALADFASATLYVGNFGTYANQLNGHVKRVALYNEALSDTNLQALTS